MSTRNNWKQVAITELVIAAIGLMFVAASIININRAHANLLGTIVGCAIGGPAGCVIGSQVGNHHDNVVTSSAGEGSPTSCPPGSHLVTGIDSSACINDSTGAAVHHNGHLLVWHNPHTMHHHHHH